MPTFDGSTTLVTASGTSVTSGAFTPASGAILVAKVAQEDTDGTLTISSNPTLTWTQRAFIDGASLALSGVWTAVGTGASTTVTATKTGSARRLAIVVERWSSAQLAGTPANVQTSGSGAPSATLTTVAAGSVVTWLCTDWNAVDGASRAYRSSATEDGYDFQNGIYTGYWAYQSAPSAGSQTVGLTAPAGQAWAIAGIEVQDTAPAAQYVPRIVVPTAAVQRAAVW